MTRIPFILLSTTDGSPLTGATPTVTISKDGATFTSATNTPTEIGNGYYYVDLTTTEATVTNNVIIRATATGAQLTAVVWEPEQDLSGLATSQDITNSQAVIIGAMPTTAGLATASDVTTAQAAIIEAMPDISGLSTFDPSTDTVTINSTQASTLAAASDLDSVATKVELIKSKTDNLPQSPAAVGSEMALTSAAISAVQNGLSTFNAATDTVTLNATEDGTLTSIKTKVDTLSNTDLTGIATSTDVSNAQTAIISRGNEAWLTANVSGLATSSGLQSLASHGDEYWATANVLGALDYYGTAKTSDIPTAEAIWTYPDRGLTTEIIVGISAQNIRDITESVWEAPDRTLTDMKPKPNQKNIVCTPSNVINSYGIPRLENWTNETAGTQAFDDKINTYITLAKEKMATDLNDQINAAIAYIGADNITELCAWLTGYNLYQDDESTDTDSLPETRYNQYLEQIHRIMENI